MAVKDISNAVTGLDMKGVPGLVQAELDAGTPVDEILQKGLIDAMDEVGRKFSSGEMFVPEMLMAAQVMKKGLEVIRPLLTGTAARTRGTVVIGTVKGDLHDIGKNMVAMMLEGAGFNVIDVGVDVDASAFISAARENGAEIVGLSALLTTTMPAMREAARQIKSSGLKVIIGGAPVTRVFAEDIGADGYGVDATAAVTLARQLTEKQGTGAP